MADNGVRRCGVVLPSYRSLSLTAPRMRGMSAAGNPLIVRSRSSWRKKGAGAGYRRASRIHAERWQRCEGVGVGGATAVLRWSMHGWLPTRARARRRQSAPDPTARRRASAAPAAPQPAARSRLEASSGRLPSCFQELVTPPPMMITEQQLRPFDMGCFLFSVDSTPSPSPWPCRPLPPQRARPNP